MLPSCLRVPSCCRPVTAVTSASDGMEALQLLRGSAPDTFQLVLTVSGCGKWVWGAAGLGLP